MIRSFDGKTPKIAASALISEAAYIIGDVEIGEETSVWPGAVIRGDFTSIKIGKNTKIEDNAVVHSTVPVEIGDNVTIGHGAVMHGVKVGNYTLIGNNATVLERAKIGDFCIIAAGALVSPGIEVPDNSFVIGIPGEIKPLEPRHRQRLERLTNSYTALVKRYKELGF